MNLDNTIHIQPVQNVFAIVFTGSFIIILVMFIGIMGIFQWKDLIPLANANAYYIAVGVVLIIYISCVLQLLR